MAVVKAGLHSFIVKVLAGYFKLTNDTQIIVDFHDMHMLLR